MKTVATLIMILALSVSVAADNGIRKNNTSQPAQPEKKSESQLSPQMRDMMKEAGVSEEMLIRTQALSNAPLYLDSAPALLGMSDYLQLTPDQKVKLERINAQSRAQSLRVLTEEQRQKLGQIPAEPATPMQMALQIHQRMAPVVQRRMQQQQGLGGEGGEEGCEDEEKGEKQPGAGGEGGMTKPSEKYPQENGGQIPEPQEHEME